MPKLSPMDMLMLAAVLSALAVISFWVGSPP